MKISDISGNYWLMILSERLYHSHAALNSFHLRFQFFQNMEERVKLNSHSNEFSTTVITEKATCTEICWDEFQLSGVRLQIPDRAHLFHMKCSEIKVENVQITSLPHIETRAPLMVSIRIEAAEARLPGGSWASPQGSRARPVSTSDTAPPPTKSSYICN